MPAAQTAADEPSREELLLSDLLRESRGIKNGVSAELVESLLAVIKKTTDKVEQHNKGKLTNRLELPNPRSPRAAPRSPRQYGGPRSPRQFVSPKTQPTGKRSTPQLQRKRSSGLTPASVQPDKEMATSGVKNSYYVGSQYRYSMSEALPLLEYYVGRYEQRCAQLEKEQGRQVRRVV